MTDLAAYMSDWHVAEREYEARERHMKTCTGCTWCVGAAPAAEPAAPAPKMSRASALYKWDDSPLVAAAATGDVEWVKELLAAEDVDVNELSSAYEYMPLIAAAQQGHVEVVRILLQTGACDLTKKHMDGYISALDSALYGYNNFEGVEDEFTPEIRAMIIRAHMETADRIKEETLLHIEASGAVVPEYIKVFRTAGGVRIAPKYSIYSKKAPGQELNLNDPPAAKMQAIIVAAKRAADSLAARKAAADAAAAAAAAGVKAEKLKKVAGPSAAPSRLNAWGGAGGGSRERYEGDDDEDDADRHPMFRKKAVEAYDPSLDDKYGKMSRRFNF